MADVEWTKLSAALQTAGVVAQAPGEAPDIESPASFRYRVYSRVGGSNVSCLVDLTGGRSVLTALPGRRARTTGAAEWLPAASTFWRRSPIVVSGLLGAAGRWGGR